MGNDGVANAGPIHLHGLRIVVGIVGDEGQNVTADVVESRRSSGVDWIGILDVHVAGKEFERIELVQRHEGIRSYCPRWSPPENSMRNTPTPEAAAT